MTRGAPPPSASPLRRLNERHSPSWLQSLGLLARFRPRHEDRVVSEFEKDIIRRVHDLAELELRDVMTPRVDVVFLTHPVTPEQVAEAVRDSGHSCFPVVTEDLDDVDGVLVSPRLDRRSVLCCCCFSRRVLSFVSSIVRSKADHCKSTMKMIRH